MAGTGKGEQNVLIRADLLTNSQQLERTSLQLEYLPTGVICRGTVTSVQSYGFTGHCTTPLGARRVITARWQLQNGNNLQGTVDSKPLAA